MKKLLNLSLILLLTMSYIVNVTPAYAQDEPPAPVESVLPEFNHPAPAPNPADPTTLVMVPDLVDVSAVINGEGAIEPNADATFTVNSTVDLTDAAPGNGVCAASNGACTLRAAISESNSLAGTQTIILPDNIYYINSELGVVGVLNIQGASEAGTIIDGKNASRGIAIRMGSGPHVFSNLTIRNAWNNATTEPDRYGGGIFNDGNLTLNNVTVTGSRAFTGGGIYNNYWFGNNIPTLYLNNVEISHNYAPAATWMAGAGGLHNGAKLIADGIDIFNNSTREMGGGFYNNSYHPDVVMKNFSIHDNSAPFGAGVGNDLTELESGYGLRMENGSISNNIGSCCPSTTGGPAGAGIDNNMAILRLTNVSINGNVTNNGLGSNYGYGGGIVNIQYMEMTNVSMVNNKAHYGAAIYNGNYNNWGNQLTMINGTISNNGGPGTVTSSEGAALFNVGVGRARFINSTITQNRAVITGGLRVNGTSGFVELTNSILAGNFDDYQAQDCSGNITSSGYNIINNYSGVRGFTCNYSAQASDILNLTPSLGFLIGSPLYHPLISGSEAINKGTNSSCPAVDAKGSPRPYLGICDIGADEWGGLATATNMLYIPFVHK